MLKEISKIFISFPKFLEMMWACFFGDQYDTTMIRFGNKYLQQSTNARKRIRWQSQAIQGWYRVNSQILGTAVTIDDWSVNILLFLLRLFKFQRKYYQYHKPTKGIVVHSKTDMCNPTTNESWFLSLNTEEYKILQQKICSQSDVVFTK